VRNFRDVDDIGIYYMRGWFYAGVGEFQELWEMIIVKSQFSDKSVQVYAEI
jgi:hypothetical protein